MNEFEYMDILSTVIENGRWTTDSMDELETEVEFEANERGLSDEEVEAVVAYARQHAR
jgi:hypothetical protein